MASHSRNMGRLSIGSRLPNFSRSQRKFAEVSFKFGDPANYVFFGWREGPRPWWVHSFLFHKSLAGYPFQWTKGSIVPLFIFASNGVPNSDAKKKRILSCKDFKFHPGWRHWNVALWRFALHCLLWCIWWERNARCFEGFERSILEIKSLFFLTLLE